MSDRQTYEADAMRDRRALERELSARTPRVPEPTAEPMDVFQAEAQRARSVHPSPPTREQIAEAIYGTVQRARTWADAGGSIQAYYLDAADAVLALIQNGADR